MLEIIQDIPAHVFGVKATNKVDATDIQDVLIPGLDRLVKKHKKIHYLLVLETEVKHFTAEAWLQDLFAGIKHFKNWERIAVVTAEEHVRKFTDLFNYIAPGKSKGFAHDQKEQAIKWVSEKEVSSTAKASNELIAGAIGAFALNFLHESMKRFATDVPRIDKLGKESVNKSLSKLHVKPLKGDSLYITSLVSDVVSNSLYYSMIPNDQSKILWPKSVVYGLVAGFGALVLPEKLGLRSKSVNRTKQTKILTVAYYVFGALVTAAAYSLLKRSK